MKHKLKATAKPSNDAATDEMNLLKTNTQVCATPTVASANAPARICPRRSRGIILSALVITLCSIGHAGTSVGAEITVSSIAAPEHGKVQVPAVEIQARRERIREFFKERHKRLNIVATTKTRSGQIVDWIWPWTQTPDGKIAEPPHDEASIRSPDKKVNLELEKPGPHFQVEERVLTEVQAFSEARGPDGTVPVVRFDVENYLASTKVPPKDPMEFLTKIPPPAPASNDRYYVVWQRFGTFYGSAGRVNIWNTSGPVNNETSIGQVAVIRGTPMQAIETGKIELQSLNGDLRPHFFVYYRTNGGASGDWVGGYNDLVDGWVQYSSSVSPGMSLVAWESQTGGNQYSLDIEVRLWEGNWWVKAAGEWAGYYPYCKGGDAPPCDNGTLFSASGIRDQASRMDWYGEVFDSSAPTATSTDMGSGRFASTGWQNAAYFRNLTYYWAPSTYWWWNSGSLSVTDSSCYTGSGPFYSSDSNWRNWFYFGGPGKEAAGCN